MPNAPKTPLRSVRVPDELWDETKNTANERGETVTDVILRALRRYTQAAKRQRGAR